MIHGEVWMSYYTVHAELQKHHLKYEIYTPTLESYTCTSGIWFLLCRGLNSLSKVLTDLLRQNDINV